MIKYIPIQNPGRNANFVKVELYYNKGGMNYFTYREEKRGYYLSVSPVYRERGMESYTAFTGTKQLIKETSRKSEKAYTIALSEIDNFLPALLDIVCNKNNITLLE
jgi:hypothetical protein